MVYLTGQTVLFFFFTASVSTLRPHGRSIYGEWGKHIAPHLPNAVPPNALATPLLPSLLSTNTLNQIPMNHCNDNRDFYSTFAAKELGSYRFSSNISANIEDKTPSPTNGTRLVTVRIMITLLSIGI